MTDLEFIAALDLARDARLHPPPGPRPGPFEALRRGEASADIDVAVGGRLRAAVNAGSLVSFVAGVTPAEKSDVLFSTQLAQRAASARHDRHTATDAWYEVYVAVLERLGWAGESFAFSERRSGSGTFRMDRSALDVIATVATGNQLAILVKAIEVMKNLADEDGAIRVFELQAQAERSGNFQLGAVERSANGALSLAIGAFRFEASDRRRRSLFWTWGSEEIRFWAAARKMTLNQEHYAGLRAAVKEKLGAEAGDYLAALPIA
ncbi:hypothetical protein STVA_08340 [Allostella vacuolata]|nr:hypothetical protein STVA_08340 [Stella vacuolata]